MTPEQTSYTITYGSRRDRGLVRQENQDQLISFDSSVFGQVFLLADGMGGHEGGAIAANMAITGFKQHFQALSAKLSLRECLEEAGRLTNRDIYEKGNEKDGGANALRMGSTLVVCVVSAGTYVVAHAGDSRCYVFRDGVLIRLTRDHTSVQKMVDAGILTPEDAKNHPDASVLTRAFGQRPTIELEISEPFSLSPNETLVLCSDGLYGYVEEAAIIEKLRHHPDPQAAADALLQLALDAGGHDNISIFAIRAEPSSPKAITAPDFPIDADPAQAGENSPSTISQDAVPARADALPQVAGKQTATPPVPVPLPAAGGGNRLRLASWLIVIAFLLLAGPLIAFLRPDIVPVALREKLIAWGIPLPARQNNIAPIGEPAPAIPSYAPGAPPPAAPEPLAGSTGAQSETAGAATLAESAPSAGGSGPVTPLSEPARPERPVVFVVFPPNPPAVFKHEIESYAAKIRNAGYQVTEIQKSAEVNSVWRSVTANPATFAPREMFLSVVFLSGSESDAEKICHQVPCTEHIAPVPAGEIARFHDNFGASRVAVFAYPRPEPIQVQTAAPATTGAPAAKPRE